MKTYKVWVCVEQYDDKTDKYEDIDLSFIETAEFKSMCKAVQFACALNEMGEIMKGAKP